ncbi:MAG: fibronectin type III domain-containing protein [Waddliaceae bacterium]
MRLFFFFCLLLSPFLCRGDDPIAVYLTWQGNPQTTMTVQWLSPLTETTSEVYYQNIDADGWKIAVGTHENMPNGLPYLVHRVELTQLTPGASYFFKPGKWERGPYKFRTMPLNLENVRFAVGGDMYHDELDFCVRTNRQVARVDPMFVLVGGDLAYAEGRFPQKNNENQHRWVEWLAAWSHSMITPHGYMIPLLPTVGNHDTIGRYDQTPRQASLFYSLFAFPSEQGFQVLDFGHHLSIFALDSGHTHPIDGLQAQWLYHALKNRRQIPYKFAFYHVPAFPSVRRFDGEYNRQIRQHWVPIFETFGLSAAFEHHDHAYKRTYPLYQGHVDPHGVLYLGDGGWGVKHPRRPKSPKKVWYLVKTARERHFILVDVKGKDCYFTAINDRGQVIDRCSQHFHPRLHILRKSRPQPGVSKEPCPPLPPTFRSAAKPHLSRFPRQQSSQNNRSFGPENPSHFPVQNPASK